jgi:hypothetical protein
VTDKESSTRADLVRQRRKKDENRRVSRPAKRATLPAPTMPRRGATLDASTVRAKPKARLMRQYDAMAAAPPMMGQLSVPRSSALPRIRVGWRLLSFFLVALFGAGIYFAWTLPTFRATGPTLVGNQMLRVEEIESVLRLNNAPIFLVIPAKAEAALRVAFPEITSAKVSVELPNKVVTTITERQPVIRWEQEGGFAWVDAEGVAFIPRGEAQNLVVVSASGSPPAGLKSESDPFGPVPYVAPQIIESIRLLAPHIPQGSVLLYNPKFGIGWVDNRGWTVWFGSNAEQTDVKLLIYSALLDSLAQRGITPSFINVAYPGAPYYRLGQ